MTNYSIIEILSSYNNVGLALYRYPYQKEVHYIIDDCPETTVDMDNFAGFVVQSFDQKNQLGIKPKYSGIFKDWQESFAIKLIECKATDAEDDQFISKQAYTETILDALDNIDQGLFSKVVLSRPLFTEQISYKSAQLLWEEMVNKYPNAFVSLYKLPNGSIWISASPELLLSKQKEQILTCSLAGTKWGFKNIEAVLWTEKEKREQKIVTDYIEQKIIEEFKDAELKVEGPYTLASGHLFHLKTDIKIQGIQSLSKLINVLHPTPAVCGQPKGNSLDFIRMFEGYNRKFYAGFHGPVNMGDSTSLFVNLRCAELFNDGASIYVGGGIVKKSNPNLEWEETEQKARIIMNLLNN